MSFNSGLQCVNGTTFRSRATPRVDCNVGSLGRVALIGRAVNRIRCEEKFHALDVSGWRAIAFIHVTATNPLRSRRHAYLIPHPVVADRCPRGMRTVKEIIAWERGIVTARIPGAVVNGIVPVVIVIGHDAVPAAVMRLKRIMRPPYAGVGAGHNNVLPGEPERPYLGRVCVVDPRLDRFRTLGVRRRVFDWSRLRQFIMDLRIAFYSCHVRSRRQRFG